MSAIKSDGGSSSYYDIQLPDNVMSSILERHYAGDAYIKTEELIAALGNDFDIGNLLKCTVRINSKLNGVGKEGNSVGYDARKIIYTAEKLIELEK